ncbi:DEAD/DEAH box helicase [Myxococcus virescens]|uniref:Helicase conserved C-terminal domain-containing protein n=1 Tax=Myxococcus virescens TaxID=83456 RepID=A0A511H556_9BACT|nr:helicase-related protein [Myxococcus virescens]GEL68666.1 hypothetical protein MVI01_04500 [Myxococcus virescens]SDE49875.1 Helicase conserved C-terminal domain-containing protein [Myxococcus virescens]
MTAASIQVGTLVRKVSDTQMVGKVLDLRHDEQLEETLARVKFGNGIQTLSLIELEPFDVEGTDLWTDLQTSRFSRSQAFRTLMTYERLRSPPSPITSAFGTARARFFPYQFKPVLKFLENPNQRVLIADDVGLGKTIEAGYILREWRARQPLANVLIVVPARLRTKWRDELAKRFEERFDIVGASEIRRVLDQVERGKDLPEFHWIASYETIRDAKLVEQISEVRPGIDLLIMDEAHRVRNRDTLQYKAALALSQCADAIVLLSATPVQTGQENLHTLVDLLEPGRYGTFGNFKALVDANRPVLQAMQFVSAGQLAHAADALQSLSHHPLTESLTRERHFAGIVERLRTASSSNRAELVRLQRDVGDFSLLGHLISRTRKLEVMEDWPVRDPQNPIIHLTPDEKAIYSAVREITRLLDPWGSDWGQSMGALMAFRYTASCIPAAVDYLRSRLAEGGLIPRPETLREELEIEVLEEEGPLETGTRAETQDAMVRRIHEVLSRCPKPGKDSKFSAFLSALRKVWADDRSKRRTRRKVVVFSFFKRTLAYLQAQLAREGIPSHVIHGDISIEEREGLIEQFLESSELDVLLSSEVGGEGIDLQVASVVVNYDLPWNPMVVEQRIGRVDRIGQKANRIVVINLVSDETVEERILFRLYERIGVFRESIGEIDDILGPMEVRGLMLDALKGDLTEEQLERQMEHTAQAAERKRQLAGTLARDVDGLLAADQSFLDEINHLVKRRRLPESGELKELLMQVLETRYSGVSLDESPSRRPATLHLGMSAVRQLQDWSRRYGGDGQRLVGRAQQGHLPVTFDADVAMQHPGCEFIQARHPLIQFAVDRIQQDAARSPGAFALLVESDKVPEGTWVLGVWGIELKASRPEHRLEAVACRLDAREVLVGDEADALLVSCLSGSEDLDPLPSTTSDQLVKCCDRIQQAFSQRYARLLRETQESEERRTIRLRATWEQTLTSRRDAARKALNERRQKKARPFAIQMAEKKLAKHEAALKAKLEEFKTSPKLQAASREIAAALVHVRRLKR